MRTSVKYLVIYRHREKYTISEMCRFFDVSRSGYYDYVKRMEHPDRDLPLAEQIRTCQAEVKQTYGYRRVQIWLDRQGIHRNPKTVLRVMQKFNLLSVVRRKKYQHYGDCLSIIRDLYDNSIITYKTGTEQNIQLVLSTVREARRKENVTAELQLHSDQGFQYTSQAYFRLTQSYGITPSMSRRGNPYDNALAENFFSILKTECIYRARPRTYEEARLLIGEYIHFYNYQRIQLKTKLTPMEYRCQFVA